MRTKTSDIIAGLILTVALGGAAFMGWKVYDKFSDRYDRYVEKETQKRFTITLINGEIYNSVSIMPGSLDNNMVTVINNGKSTYIPRGSIINVIEQ